mmetsp:Transcript_88784/g.286943  ORF Transcript_88784/g.286943 Transcript_88784/m.286943 type:complete len:256 (-) Transcript_88784:1921-2688(-)
MGLILLHVLHFASPVPIHDAAIRQQSPDRLRQDGSGGPPVFDQAAHAEVVEKRADGKAETRSCQLAGGLVPQLEGIDFHAVGGISVNSDHHVDEALADPRSPFLLVVGSAAPQVAGEILVAGQLELAAVALEHLAAAPRVGVVLLHLEDERPHGKGAREDVLATREHKQAMLKQLDHKALVQTSSVRIVAANGSHPRPQAVPRHQDGTEHPVAPSEHISKRAAVEDQQAAAPCELRQQLSAATRENHLAVPHAVL